MVHTVYVNEGMQKVNQHLGESYSYRHIRNLKTILESLRTAADTKFHDVFVESEKITAGNWRKRRNPVSMLCQPKKSGNVSAATPEDYY